MSQTLSSPPSRSQHRIVASPQVSRWYARLNDRDMRSIRRAIDALAHDGPALARPLGADIHGARHRHMRELRSVGGNLRVLYAMDQRGRAVLLIGGDKTNQWKRWYKRNIKRADRLLDRYNQTGGADPRWRNLKIGRRFETGGR